MKVSSGAAFPSTQNKPGMASNRIDLEVPSQFLTVLVAEDLVVMGSALIRQDLERTGEIFRLRQVDKDEGLQQLLFAAALMAA